MDFDFSQGFETSSFLFRVLALLAVGGAYVLFEALLTRLKDSGGGSGGAGSGGAGGSNDTHAARIALELEPLTAREELTRMALEAYRPISSWSSMSKLTD